MDELKDAKGDKAILDEARKRFEQCVSDNEEEREKQLQDLIFADVEQWPPAIRASRENDVNGSRPCLTVDKINQYITQVVNDMRQNKPSIKARPVDDEADPKTAKVFQELIRRIEDDSHADIAYLTAGESAVKIGEGYFRFVTDFVDENSFDQEILFKPVKDTFSVYLGPHMMPDGSDAEYGFVLEDMPKERFKREFPKAKSDIADFSTGLASESRYWTNNETIRVCEYFYFDYKDEELLLLEDGSTLFKKDFDEAVKQGFEAPGIVKSRPTKTKSVKWCKLTGLEILEKRDWAGKYIPIVKVEGRASTVKGKKVIKGLVRPAKDSLRAYNYWFSTITEKLALSPKTPFVGAVGQFATEGDKWNKANSVNYSRLEYDPIDVNGAIVPPPQRQAPAPLEAAMIKHLEIIEHDIQTSLGMFKASVGQSDPQQSGRALQALQRQTDTGTFHFPDNVATSIRHGGRILIDLIPKIMDTKMVIRVLGEDGVSGSAEIDPNQEASAQDHQDDQGGIKTIYNLGVGKYDVTATVGPSYSTKRMEQADMMLQVTQSQPELMQTIGDLLFKSFDWPMADKISERLKKMLPPQLQEPEDGKPAIPPAIQAAMQQIQQQNQQLDQKAQALSQAEQEIDKKSMDVQRKSTEVFVKESQIKTEAIKLELEKYANELAAKEQAMSQGSGEMPNIDAWKAQLDAETKLKIAQIKQETDLQIALLQAEGQEDVLSNGDDMKSLVDSLQQNVKTLMDSHKASQDGLLEAVTKPKKTKATAVKQADGSWQLIKEEM
jgi:hypothetical protein